MRNVRILAAFAAAFLTSKALTTEIVALPFEEVRPGMRGVGRTVFRGTNVETFDVEILGTLPNIGPGQNLILGRCSGGPLAETGVMAGMSGSPVFVDGRLVGAVAYAWGFAKDAIAGITPIGEMLAVADRRSVSSGGRRSFAVGIDDLRLLGSPEAVASFLVTTLPSRVMHLPSAPLVAQIPVSVTGIGAAGTRGILPSLSRIGLLPVQGGGAGSTPDPSPRPEPGSAVGLKLVRGDVDMTATGTVTWVDGDRVLAFGHPLFGLGSVELPLTGARVEALLPSLERSLRLATPLAELGTVMEDRNAGIFGRLGLSARMIPVRLRITFAGKGERSFSFDVADDPMLAPLLLFSATNGVLASLERLFGDVTLRLREGSVIKVRGQEDVDLRDVFAGSSAPLFATGTPAFLLYLLLNNDLSPPQVDGVNLVFDYEDVPRAAHVRRVTLDRYRVRPGESVEATIVLSPFRGSDIVLTRKLQIPSEIPPGPLALNVGDRLAVGRTETGDTPPMPKGLSELIALINRVPRNDRVYVVAAREDTGVFLGGTRLPNLPPSVQGILSRPRSRGNFVVVPQRGVLEEQIPVDFAILGLARVQLEVEAP